VAVNAQNDIIVADTNNHRIQIFDKEGRFKFQFGEVSFYLFCGFSNTVDVIHAQSTKCIGVGLHNPTSLFIGRRKLSASQENLEIFS